MPKSIAFVLVLLHILMSFVNAKGQDTMPHLSQTIFRASSQEQEIRHIIFMIGDGMGLSQITAGMYANKNYLALERCQVIGIQKPYASSHLVTDSAAGATAFSCGKKTYNGAIGVDRDTVPCRTIFEEAESRGWATGIVATSTIVHATPASYFAHTNSRKNYEEIAAAIPNSGMDYFVGGGLKYFRNRASDERDLIAEMEDDGYYFSNYFQEEYEQVIPDPSKPFGFLTSYEDPLPAENGRDYLLQATIQGLEFLAKRSDEGFFFLVEGSQIDWGGHANNGDYIISEMLDFDKAIAAVLDFADRTPGTLVVITADHEAGGCAIQPESTWKELKFGFTTIGHTGTLIPVFAYGAGAHRFGGIYENTAIYDKLMELLGW